ncbi:D-alanine--D-alanine ligase [Mollicutes bacterium LVI A0039]|nr:D-alanine--D-alanine ligase [Mollicutes bacterium LVI A0039]
MKVNVAILFGGNSVEHEISIISSIQAIENIDKQKYNVIPVYITKKLEMYSDSSFTSVDPFIDFDASKYKQVTFVRDGEEVFVRQIKGLFNKLEERVDVVLPIVHGTGVEDGTLQGYLKMFDLPIAGPTVLSGAIGQDKAVMKDILKANDVSQTEYLWITSANSNEQNIELVEAKLSYPVIIKPASLGSSVGIEFCNDRTELDNALTSGFGYDHKIVVEEALSDFEEYNISVFGTFDDFRLSAIEKVIKAEEFLSYEQKYVAGSKKTGGKSSGMASLSREVPANISADVKQEIERLATASYKALCCNGVVRFDVLIGSDKTIYINEVNNVPGSLSYYLWEATGVPYEQMLTNFIEQAVSKYYKDQKLVHSFDTNVLKLQGGGNKC